MPYDTNNLHYAFSVAYYDRYITMNPGTNREKAVQEANRDLLSIPVNTEKCYKNTACSFTLYTRYPGLMAGIGLSHGTGDKGEIQAGFSLDYVTGAPYIPGSSIKGAVRSAFAHADYIREVLNKQGLDVAALIDEIFEGKQTVTDENGQTVERLIPIPKRDVFYDAYPMEDGTHNILAMEAITPHDEDITKSPNPIAFIKVLPDVPFVFSFALHDGLITAEEKLTLIQTIIKDLGLGAKTNVGFGTFGTDVAARPAAQNGTANHPGGNAGQNNGRNGQNGNAEQGNGGFGTSLADMFGDLKL